MKHLLIKCDYNLDKFRKGLAHWRITPTSSSQSSPAQMFFGRRLRGFLPTIPTDINAQKNSEAINTLPSFKVGQRVRLQHMISKRWDSLGIIQRVLDGSRTYEILLDNGRIIIRNRRFLKSAIETSDESTHSSPQPSLQSSLRRSERIAKKKSVTFSK